MVTTIPFKDAVQVPLGYDHLNMEVMSINHNAVERHNLASKSPHAVSIMEHLAQATEIGK